MDDVIGSIHHSLQNPEVKGPLNLTSPQHVRCRHFAQTLGKVLRRPSFLTLPASAARLELGEMADSLLLASTRAHPAGLLDSGYEFRIPELEDAIRDALS